jgi:hypothetical protein
MARPVVAPAARAKAAIGGEQLRAAAARFAEVIPFLLSAATTPSREVLGALAPMLEGQVAALKALSVTGDSAAAHGLLIAATAAARRASDPAFAGDRLAQAHQAVGLFESATARMSQD